MKITTATLSHPRIIKLKRRLGADAVLSLLALWAWAEQERPEGRLEGLDEEEIAIAAGWDGDDRFFVTTLIELKLLDWDGEAFALADLHGTRSAPPQRDPNHDTRSEQARNAARSRWERGKSVASMLSVNPMLRIMDEHPSAYADIDAPVRSIRSGSSTFVGTTTTPNPSFTPTHAPEIGWNESGSARGGGDEESRTGGTAEEWDYPARLTRQEIQRIGAIKAAEASPATANRYLALIRAILIRAQRVWEWLDRVPAITLCPEPKQRIRWLTREQANRLLEELPAHLAAMARVALATGLREANVTGLLWSQVDTARAVAWIHPDQAKGRRAIPVPLNAEALAAIRAQAGAHHRYVFTFRGQPVTRASTAAWYKALARCELTDFRWHDLRHTWASWHVQAGTPLHVLQELGGWRTPAMVQRYAHLAPEHLAEHAARIAAPNLHHPKLRVVK